VSCSVKDASSADKYTWIDSATGSVIYHGAEWTVKPCSHQSCLTYDGYGMTNNCVNSSTDGLLMLECHVTVGMTTALSAVVLSLNQDERTCNIATTESGESCKNAICCLKFIISLSLCENFRQVVD